MLGEGERPARFHPGEYVAQERAGDVAAAAHLGPVVKPFLALGAEKFLASAHFAVAASLDDKGQPHVSPLAVQAGQFGTVGSCGVTLPAGAVSADDVLLANLAGDRRIGLLYFDPATRRRYRVNGEVVNAGADPLEVSILEAYPNCPKYIVRQTLRYEREASSVPATTGAGLEEREAKLLSHTSLFFVGSADPTGQLDVASRSGDAGFVRQVGPYTFEVPDFSGNALYQTIGNLVVEPRAAVGLIDGNQFVVLVGSAEINWGADPVFNGVTGRSWKFTVHAWRRLGMGSALILEGYERSAHTPQLG